MFIAWVTQKGEGCDYTIGCGNTLWRLEANNREEAITELKDAVLVDYDEEWQERELGEIILFGVIDEERFDCDKWYDEADDVINGNIKKLKEQEEYETYLKLREKFE